MPLHDPARHEAVTGGDWDEGVARAAIERIARDTHAAFSEDGLWPIHPMNLSSERPPDCLKPIYHGAAGVIWALRRLEAAGAARPVRDYRATVAGLIERSREDLRRYEAVRAYMDAERPAFLIGEAGILLLHWTMAPSDELEDRLHVAVAARVGDTRGVVWGGAGAMLAAANMHQRTGRDEWKAVWLDHARALLAAWRWNEDAGCRLWTQNLYGEIEQRLGALHGAAANAFALLKGRALLPPDLGDEVVRDARAMLMATAVHDGPFANWPMSVRPADAEPAEIWRLQHCIGAPGMINAFADLPPDPQTDALLAAAGELTWEAGPIAKLPGLCHGVPGAGYAFLELRERTGDARWLARARRFAMHAIAQSNRALSADGRRKYSLWTGDLGLAVFLCDCIEARADFPTLDVF